MAAPSRAERMRARLAARVAASTASLTVHYPPKRATAPGAAPLARPASPLTGAAPALSLTGADPLPAADAVTLKCLWLDAVSASVSADPRAQTLLAQVDGASALARVTVTDAALDADAPLAGTVFDGCDHVESAGRRYRVLAVAPVGASFYAPLTYAVWLVGAAQ